MKKKEEVKVEYYDNGNKKRETHYKDGKEDGVTTYWHEDGTKSTEIHYKDGIPGVQTWWNKDGTKKEGVDTDWYEDGTKSRESHYKDGRLDGVATCWDEDGNKDMESHYKDGKLDGVCTEWEDGTKTGEDHFKDGELDGVSTTWDEDGNKLSEKHYKDGKEVTTTSYQTVLVRLDTTLNQMKKDLMIEYQQKYDSFQSLLEEFDTCNPTKEQWDEFVKIGKKYVDMGKSFEDENGNTIQHITEVVYNQANTPNWDALEEEK